MKLFIGGTKMHQFSKIIIVFILFIAIISSFDYTYADEVSIQADNLNIRSGPSLDSQVIGEANTGETFTLIEEQTQWIGIQFNGTTGWIASEYAVIQSNTSTESDENSVNEIETEQVITPYKTSNLRNLPSTDGEIVGIIPKGTTLTVNRTIDDWIETEWEGIEGYLPSWVVTEVQPVAQNLNTVFTNKVVVLDPGHGGRDVGAIGASNAYEKNYTYKTSHNIKTYLEHLGATVYLTRDLDHYMTLTGRASFANYHQADAFISLHYNSTPQYPNAEGISTYYYKERDQLLANMVHEALLKTTNAEDRRVQFGDFQVLRTNHTPALLLELGFISNVSEELQIQNLSYQRKISQGIISGLQKYFLSIES